MAVARATPVTRHRAKAPSRSAADDAVVAGVPISHPDRPIYPELGLNKIDLARYVAAVAAWMMPHARGRPLTLVHCPAGVGESCLFLKHAKAWGPNALQRVRIQEKTKVGEYLVANTPEALVALAQMGIVEIHTWNSTIDDVERPNRLIWDLDPGPETTWPQTVNGARLLREVLSTLGLTSWVKTTGGRGLHVVVPIRPRLDWPACLDFARDLSQAIERTDGALYTTAFSKRGREAKILIDYLRNNRTNTSICAYSPRARPGAPVSMPLAWTDLGATPATFALPDVERRLARRRTDPWRDYWTASQLVTPAMVRAVRAL
jgi:bifunctional non-homologous end joining protein LigD